MFSTHLKRWENRHLHLPLETYCVSRSYPPIPRRQPTRAPLRHGTRDAEEEPRQPPLSSSRLARLPDDVSIKHTPFPLNPTTHHHTIPTTLLGHMLLHAIQPSHTSKSLYPLTPTPYPHRQLLSTLCTSPCASTPQSPLTHMQPQQMDCRKVPDKLPDTTHSDTTCARSS